MPGAISGGSLHPSRPSSDMIALGIPSAFVLVLVSVSLAACGASLRESSAPAAATGPAASASSGTATAARPAAASASTKAPARAAGTVGAPQFNHALSSFATCLRSNGVQLPSANGGQTLSLKGVDTKSPAYRSALTKCRPVLSAAFRSAFGGARSNTATPASPANITVKVPTAITAVMDRFTACMRANGVAGFPQPEGAHFNLTGTSVDASSAQYKAAQTYCNPILQTMVPRG